MKRSTVKQQGGISTPSPKKRHRGAGRGIAPRKNGPEGDPVAGAVRTCAVTRCTRPKGELLRWVLGPDGQWVADLHGRLPGRGLYVITSQDAIRAFLKRRGISPSGIGATLEQLKRALPQRFLDGIGLAKRAGCLRRGLRDVSEAVGQGARPVLLLLAADTAGHTRQKLAQLQTRHALEEVWELLDRARFGEACGHGGLVAVLAVLDVGVSRRVRADALRWRDFCGTQLS